MTNTELKEFLDAKVIQYNNPKFIESDPIQIPHQFAFKEDIEIAAFLTATIAWGNRKMIIKNAKSMMELLGNSPYDFVINHKEHHLENLEGFVHRTFNNIDLAYFITALRHIYKNHNGLETVFSTYAEMEFFLAEAAQKGWAVGGTVESHYNNGITASILYYGGTQADADAYLAQASVAYTTATGTWKEKIGTQKWLAMYNRGIEGWSEWRRLDAPTLNFPVGLSYSDIPTRFPYPFTENDMNPSYDAAAAAIGGDLATTKLWWDVN